MTHLCTLTHLLIIWVIMFTTGSISLHAQLRVESDGGTAIEGRVETSSPAPAIFGFSIEGQGMRATSINNFALEAQSLNGPGAKIIGDNGVGLVLGGSITTSSIAHDLNLSSHKNIFLRLDSDGTENSAFRVINSGFLGILRIDEEGHFEIYTGSSLNPTRIFNLESDGDLTIAGTLHEQSDQFAKELLEQVSPNNFLSRLKQLPVYRWRYKGQDELHIGPVAQDFLRLFDLGDGKYISNVDAHGVMMASIKALMQEIEELKDEINALKMSTSKY